ncbi:CBS domain-containing protein [Actinocorallia cavernae]|uniref:CBS domain-containing protein n=2 Tax=Actinomycetes TaxID=1760 RepID=A0ABP8SAX4_9ACTN
MTGDDARARDLAVEYKTVGIDDAATAAARLRAEHELPTLLVLDREGMPKAILPASQMIEILVPAYVVEDSTLAAVVDEGHADRLCQALEGRTVGECLARKAPVLPVTDPDATVLEIAALMTQAHSPLVTVVEQNGETRLLGVITATHLLHRLLGPPS